MEDTDSTFNTTDSVTDTVDLVIDATVFDDANSFVKDSDDDDDGVFGPWCVLEMTGCSGFAVDDLKDDDDADDDENDDEVDGPCIMGFPRCLKSFL